MLMAADVSSLVRVMNRYKEGEKGAEDGGRDLVTRDLLGGSAAQELDLDLKAPAGWETGLDLASGEVFLRRSPPGGGGGGGELQDLNFPPAKLPSLELKLFPVSPSASSASFLAADYQSVCTLDKVKSALERLKHNTSPSPASSSTTTASAKRRPEDDDGESTSSVDPTAGGDSAGGGGLMFAAGCPSCLSYVLVPGSNPRCPRCGAAVPTVAKKRRLDLNLSAGGSLEGKRDASLC